MTPVLYPGTPVVLLCLFLRSTEGICSVCLCTADSLSCGLTGLTKLPYLIPHTTVTLDLSHNRLARLGPGSFSGLPRLDTLRLDHNQLTALGPGVFHNASTLRYLDLSSNRLRVVEQHCLQGLWRLEELLLFNNRITRVESGTLAGLGNLKKAYFSLNQMTDFPFFSIQDKSHPFLTMLDLSSNRMTSLPWDEVTALPTSVQKGLFLHNNSLVCECSMYNVFWHWELRGFDSAKDFVDEHTCLIYGESRASLRFLKHTRYFQNCTAGKAVSLPIAVLVHNLVVDEGERVLIDCQTPLKGKALSFTWISPSQEDIAQTSVNDSLINLFPNGTLGISAIKLADSGVYVCTATDYKQMMSANREVNVTVVRPTVESFNTGYTTLLVCVVTLVLILMYLYLTPCRCRCCKQPLAPAIPIPAYDPTTSIFSPSVGPRDHSNKHVVFMEPVLEEQNGVLRASLATEQPTVQWEWDITGLT